MGTAATDALSAPRAWPAFGERPLLGANGTEPMQILLRDGGGALTDYLKVGPFMGEPAIADLARRHPLMLHLDDTLSGPDLPTEEMAQRLAGLIGLTGTPWTSEHIGFGVPNVSIDSALITQPASDLLPREQALCNIVRNARDLARRLPVPLLLENIPLFPNFAHIHVCEPDFIAAVIEDTGCDLLLDLAHARVAADVLGYEVRDYLQQLPLERAVELHISGPRPLAETSARQQSRVRENAPSVAHLVSFGDGNLIDVHAPLQEEDYTLLEWVLGRTRPKAISLEYYRQPEPLREQLVRLGGILGR